MYVFTVIASVILCNFQFIIFHLFLLHSPHSCRARQNDNFFFHILSFTLQFGNCLSVLYLIPLVSPYASEFIPCICSNMRVINMQLQMTCLLMISAKRFAGFFFHKYYSRINHTVLGNLSKGLIIFIPLYLQFVLANACGLDSFCSRNFRDIFNLLTFSSASDYKQQVNKLLIQDFYCKTQIHKMCMPIPVTLTLTNGSILIRLLSQNVPLCFFPSIAPLQPNIELRTIQTNQPSSPTPEPLSQGYTYVVGIIPATLTVLVLILHQWVFASLVFGINTDILLVILMDLLISTLIPMFWCISNNYIF